MGHAVGRPFAAVATAAIVVNVDVVVVVDQNVQPQDPPIGRATLLPASLELRAGRILGDGRTDDGIYYGLHVFQRYHPVASLSRLVPSVHSERNSSPGIWSEPEPQSPPPPIAPRWCVCVYVCAACVYVRAVR